METMRPKADIEKRLNESISFYDSRIKAWENVKRKSKKDGTNFVNLSQNFENASIGKYYPVETYATPYLSVFFENGNRYEQDEMSIFVSRYDKDLPEHNAERETRNTDYGTSNEIMTLDEIFYMISKRIENYKHYKERAEKELEMLDTIFEQVESKCNELIELVKPIQDNEIGGTTLSYALGDYIANKCKYIHWATKSRSKRK